MNKMITAMKNTFMYVTLLILGVSIVSFVLNTMTWFLYVMLTDTMHAFGYLCLGAIMCIGAFTAIDKIREI